MHKEHKYISHLFMYKSTFGRADGVLWAFFFRFTAYHLNNLENEKTKTQKGVFTMISVIHSFIDPLNTYLLDTDHMLPGII